ncbi:alpha-2-macroglobulin-like protein 1 isoform X2 [Phyllobates terribilis]|uniref:alpha-2-macroglobulin-like protein 1 isoform X2 n=1 Tax=Phyllobates terribilis TaxID=111132 RepID=UPI003CCB42D5
MLPPFIYVGLILLQICTNVEAKLRYALIFPSTMHSDLQNHICLHLEDMKGDSKVMITLTLGRKTTPLLTKLFQESSSFFCISFQIPNELDIIHQTGTLFLSIQTADELIHESRRVDIEKKQKMDAQILIQTDKPLYKPGQTVKFRIVSLNGNFQPEDMEFPLVELQDPGKNRIGQMLNISLTQGIADLSFSLSPEPRLGTYSIRVKNKVHTFQVEEYVLPKFEVILELPNSILKSMQTFPVKTCGRYTYGKPVQGTYKGSLCQKVGSSPYFVPFLAVTSPGNCINFEGKLDHLGCSSNTMRSSSFQLSRNVNTMAPIKLEGTVTITEEGTGISLSATSETSIVVSNSVSFLDPKSIYKPGMPYSVTLEVTDSKKSPVPGQKVYLTCEQCDITINETLVTDDKGRASYILENTTNWTQRIGLKASTNMENESRSRLYFWSPGDARLTIFPLYSSSKSYLNLKSLGKDNSCRSQQEVLVQYIIRNSALQKDTKQMDLYYLVTSKGHIESSGSQKIMVKSSDTDLQGDLSFKFSVNVNDSSFIHVLVYIFLPSGEMIADNIKIKMMRCFKNEVSVGFSSDEVHPGSDVSLRVQADPGSLCGLRVVDQSVVLMKPEDELTAEKVYDLFTDSQHPSLFGISMSTDVMLVPCENGPAGAYYSSPFSIMSTEEELHKLFVDMQLKIITSAEVKKPVHCPDPSARVGVVMPYGGGAMPGGIAAGVGAAPGMGVGGVAGIGAAGVGSFPVLANEIRDPLEKVGVTRKYFPETWIWQLTPIGNSGVIELQHLAPDTITDWTAGAICMGPDGFGLSPSVPLRVFQPYFVELALPYSVVRGETFTLKANVFNYLKQCIKVQTTLLPSPELELEACPECQYSSCLCADESKIFRWNVKAAKLGEVNITVRTEAVNTPDLCNNEVPLVPTQGNVDTVIKPLIVKPGGVLVEKSYSAMICTQARQGKHNHYFTIEEGDYIVLHIMIFKFQLLYVFFSIGNSKTENISLKLPVNILKDSERAYVTVVGDMMGTTLEHLDHLLTMPSGCGEQNMVRFAPNIFVLQYLEKTNQLRSEIKSKAINFMKNGYQRQLSYKRDDGSFSAYGKVDPEGNTWLTAFVVKTFSKSQPYIFVDEVQLSASYAWLTRNRFYSGCFRNVGKLFHSSMKGGVEDDVSLSTYVTIALLEAGKSPQDPLVRDSVLCLQQLALNVNNMYTQALLAYAFTLYGDTYYRKILLDRLEQKAVKKDGQLYWQPKPQPMPDERFWQRASSTEVELTSYVLLALLSTNTKDLFHAAQIVSWLSKQQNAFGGFSSTQDTIVALQAMALYAEATFSDKGDSTVTLTSTNGFREQFRVNNDNRLLLQRSSLPDIPGEYTVTSSGNSCVYVQALLRYNVPPERNDATFMIRLDVRPIQCTRGLPTRLQINIFVAYTGSRQKSNMVLIDVKMLSGFSPLKSSIEQLKAFNVIQRAEEKEDTLTLYLDEIGHIISSFSLLVEQEYPVMNLKPAAVKIYDYYEKDEYATAEYNSPCTWF